ncbi:tetratricopeptide repeat-containing sulfotransferase family protein [Sphingopyxis sp. DBS4]|uniref:tetratricopeptide repeat-containing sulfotransferase family protein n=1 Tax=Sphingopyxis sp. DBS4 TaxID=2968500 RepID=UPI00214ABDA5|nr:tetratricopeptide repeat-containing sulfotransferase family protein [Sphingopyxis sp. DBS4]
MASAGRDDDSGLNGRLDRAMAFLDRDPAQALRGVESILASDPDFLPARRALAHVMRRQGNHPGADQVEREAIAVGIARPGFAAAQEAFLAGELEKAEVLIRQHLRQDPKDPAAALMLGEIAARCDAKQEAENLFRRATLLAPGYLEPWLALAKHCRDSGRYPDALFLLDELLARKADHLQALSLRAAILVQLRRFDEADAAFLELHAQCPEDARGWANHAFMLKTVGRQDDAVQAYRTALGIDPANAQAWWGLANLKTVRFGEADVEGLRRAFERTDLAADDRIHLAFALGKALDDNRDFAGAFAAYSEGARQRLEQVPYDPASVTGHIAKSRRTCTADYFAERRDWGSAARDPIFIVSLPRSGSTLVEQILASHPLIEGTEELHDIERIALACAPNGGTGGWLDTLPSLSRDKVRELGDHYVEATRRFRHSDRPFFTDKMPSNWVFLGLIRTILPNAKIIDVRRHPMGCGFANFSQHFNWGINFSYDLAHIGHFYTTYLRQMAHFDAVLPGYIHHLTYENLVQNTEAEVTRLLDYLGLPFDEACLRFFENDRAVYTPSSEQVRSPINREGIERWHSYRPFLDPLAAALGPVLDHYPDYPPGEF